MLHAIPTPTRFYSPPKRPQTVKFPNRLPRIRRDACSPHVMPRGPHTLQDADSLDGLFSKVHKAVKKIRNVTTKPLKKLAPKKVRALVNKIESKADKVTGKIANNKTLNKVVDVAAVAVGSYFYPPLATMAKSMLVSEGAKAVGKKVATKKQKAAEKKALKKAAAEQSKMVDEALADIPSATREKIKALVKQKGPDVLNSEEVRLLLAPVIGQVAGQTAAQVSQIQGGSAAAQQAYAEGADAIAQQKAVTGETSAAGDIGMPQWLLPVAIGGGALLLFLALKK